MNKWIIIVIVAVVLIAGFFIGARIYDNNQNAKARSNSQTAGAIDPSQTTPLTDAQYKFLNG